MQTYGVRVYGYTGVLALYVVCVLLYGMFNTHFHTTSTHWSLYTTVPVPGTSKRPSYRSRRVRKSAATTEESDLSKWEAA